MGWAQASSAGRGRRRPPSAFQPSQEVRRRAARISGAVLILYPHARVGEALRERPVRSLGRGKPVGHLVQFLLRLAAGLLEPLLDLRLPAVPDHVHEPPSHESEDGGRGDVAEDVDAGHQAMAARHRLRSLMRRFVSPRITCPPALYWCGK